MKTQINKSFKSKVMKAAWTSIRKGKSANMSEALKSAWKWAKEKLITPSIEVKTLYVDMIEKVTEKAIMVRIDSKMGGGLYSGSRFWIPKSQILDSENGFVGTDTNLSLTPWFASKLIAERKVSNISIR